MLGLVSERAPLRRGQLKPRPGSDMLSSSQNGRSTLLLWLNVPGWQVEVERDGEILAGVARHCTPDGSTFRVGASARTRDELALRLFEGAMKIVEARGQRHQRALLA